MILCTYNVNGIRSALRKGLLTWLRQTSPDVLALQEIRAERHQAEVHLFEDLGYHTYWYPALKKGYAGVAILSKHQPRHVEYGCGAALYDDEGRILRADFDDFSMMSVYFPSGSGGEVRQAFKMDFCRDFSDYVHDLKKSLPNLIISGDFNICHQPIDLHNPRGNARSPGFLPEERQWLSRFLENGFVDVFREMNPQQQQYTWWSLRAGARARNLGWRLDYHLMARPLLPRLQAADILPDALHADHCPARLVLA